MRKALVCPVASTMVEPAPAPCKVRGFEMVTISLYVPAATLMMAPGAAVLTASWMRVKQPCDPSVLTHARPRLDGALPNTLMPPPLIGTKTWLLPSKAATECDPLPVGVLVT